MDSLFLLSQNPHIARKGTCLSHLEQKSLFSIKLFSLQTHGVKPDATVALEEKSVCRSGLGRNLGIETFTRQAGSRTVMLTWVEVMSAERPEQLRIWSWKKESLFITLAKLHVIILHALHLKHIHVNIWAGCKVPKEWTQNFCTSFKWSGLDSLQTSGRWWSWSREQKGAQWGGETLSPFHLGLNLPVPIKRVCMLSNISRKKREYLPHLL